MTTQLIELNNGVGMLNGTIEGLNGRFADLQNLVMRNLFHLTSWITIYNYQGTKAFLYQF